MGSVGSSDSSNSVQQRTANQDEIQRKRKEAAATNQDELMKRHQKEIRRLHEEHYAEVEGLKKAHESQMDALRKQTKNDITERDHRYLQDTEDMRDLYRRQLQNQADEVNKRETATRKSLTDELDHEKRSHDMRAEEMTTDYDRSLLETNQQFGTNLKTAREAEQIAVRENHDKVQAAFDQDANVIRTERNEKVGGLQRNFDEYRQNTEERLRNQEIKHLADKQKASDEMLRAVTKERNNKQEAESTLREGFKDNLETQRGRFEKELKRQREAGDLGYNSNKASVTERIKSNIDRLQEDKQDLRDTAVRDEEKLKSAHKQEVRNINDAYQRNLEHFADERQEMVRTDNDRAHKLVANVRKEYDETATQTDRHYKQQMEEQNQIHRDAYQNIKGDFEIRNQQTQAMADRRVKQFYDQVNEEKVRNAEQEADNHAATQRSHEDTLKSMRGAMDADKQGTVSYLEQRLLKQEMEHTQRTEGLVSKYEKELQRMRDQQVRDRRLAEENLKRTVDELQRAHRMSLDQVESQNKDRIRQIDNTHSEELRTLSKRNDEKFDTVMAHMKKT